MRMEPGFLRDLRQDIAGLSTQARSRLDRPGALTFDELLRLVCQPGEPTLTADHPLPSDVVAYDELPSTTLGIDAIRDGKVAFVVLAGGAGTRAGGPKSLLRLPKLDVSLASVKLTQASVIVNGEPLQLPVWFMASPDHAAQLVRHLSTITPLPPGCVFEQFEGCRLGPDNRILCVAPGAPAFYPTGHGDVGPALVESGVLAENPAVKYCVIVNVDNVLAAVDPAVLDHHIRTGNVVTCEVVGRQKRDAGGCLAWADGKLQVIENFRLEPDYVDEARYLNTNTMIINVDALKQSVPWRWHRVRKYVDNRVIVQYERFVQQYTEHHRTGFVLVPREKRYLPIKDEADLARAGEKLNGNGVR